jgi:PAS domain S-box-containing protein
MLVLFDGDFAPARTVSFLEENLGAGLWCWDARADTMSWSRGMYQLLGYERGGVEPSFELMRSLVHPGDRLVAGEFANFLEAGVPLYREFRIIRSDKRVRWVANRAEFLMDNAGNPSKAIGALFDITERQNAQSALRAVEERYRVLAGALSAIVWHTRPDGSVADIPDWRAMTGQTVAEVEGFGWINAIHRDDRNSTQEAWKHAIVAGASCSIDFRVRLVDGAYRWMNFRAAPAVGSERQVREWVCVCISSSDRTSVKAGETGTLTGAQIRAARAILNWSVKEIADASGVSVSTIRRMEEHDGASNMRPDCIASVRRAFEDAGVEFLSLPSGRPGVRPRGNGSGP